MAEEPQSEATIQTPAGSVSVKSKHLAEITTVILLAVMLVLATLWWQHDRETSQFQNVIVTTLKEVSQANTMVVRELTSAQRDANAAMKEQNCLLRFAQNERQQNADFCRQMGTNR